MAKQYATWRQLLYLGAPQACPHAASPPCRRGKPAPVKTGDGGRGTGGGGRGAGKRSGFSLVPLR
ncbi:hypothetical protein AM228_19720 [Planktothricoides sp. SR001]|nr:hypothetical protein AM228_19720 [Planktothricoides sp. SR001]